MEKFFFCYSNDELKIKDPKGLTFGSFEGGYYAASEQGKDVGDLFILPFGQVICPGRTGEDTYSLIADLYQEFGLKFADQLEGAFGLVILDKKLDKVFLYRDKFGIKELLFTDTGSVFAATNIASEIYLRLDIKKQFNPKKNLIFVGSHYRHFEDPRGDSFFEGVYGVLHSEYVEYSKKAVSRNRYWDLELLDLSEVPYEELKEEYLSRIKSSVSDRLQFCENPGFTISSGMDSSSVAYFASEVLERKVDLFTTVYAEDTEYNEHEDIVEIAAQVGRSWEHVMVTGEHTNKYMSVVTEKANAPFATITQLLHFYVAEQAKEKGHDALFGGLGGDEANCGEIEEYMFFFADLLQRGLGGRLHEEMEGWIKYHATEQYPKSEAVFNEYAAKYIDYDVPGYNRCDTERFSKYFFVFKDDFLEENVSDPTMERPYSSYVRNRLYQDLFNEAIPCVLRAESFSGNYVGIDCQYPYLDSRVIQYGFSIPLELKYRDGITKMPLRDAMTGKVPDSTISNFFKRGWNAPFGEWLKVYFLPHVEKLLDNPTERMEQVYKIESIRGLLKEHLDGKENHMMFFWQFLNYEAWIEANS